MYLQTKKVVIIYIVTIITAASIINTLYDKTQDTIMQISIVTSEELSYKTSFAQNIYGEFSVEGLADEDINRYGSSLFQLPENSQAQFSSIVSSSQMIIVIGDSFNDILPKSISENPQKQFVLVENSQDIKGENVESINIDYDQVYEDINRVSTKENKALVIVCNAYSDLALNKYYQSNINSNVNVKLLAVDNTTDIVELKQKITEQLNNGFTNVYSLNPYNNQTVVEAVSEFNNKQASSLLSEIASENESEITSQTSDKEASEIKDAKLKYMSLNQTEYLTSEDDLQIDHVIYTVSDEINDLIDDMLSREISNDQVNISVT